VEVTATPSESRLGAAGRCYGSRAGQLKPPVSAAAISPSANITTPTPRLSATAVRRTPSFVKQRVVLDLGLLERHVGDPVQTPYVLPVLGVVADLLDVVALLVELGADLVRAVVGVVVGEVGAASSAGLRSSPHSGGWSTKCGSVLFALTSSNLASSALASTAIFLPAALSSSRAPASIRPPERLPALC
jgi:hypothetical protein